MRRGCGGTRRVRGYKFGFHSADSRSRDLGSSSDQAQASVGMGSRRDFPWCCLHLFVPAKIRTRDGHGNNNLHTRRIARGIDGINV